MPPHCCHALMWGEVTLLCSAEWISFEEEEEDAPAEDSPLCPKPLLRYPLRLGSIPVPHPQVVLSPVMLCPAGAVPAVSQR